MGRRTRRYEVEFVACLLALGPMDYLHEAGRFKAGVWTEQKKYKAAVMEWWVDWHGLVNTPPTLKSQLKFYKRFRTWQKVHQRRLHHD